MADLHYCTILFSRPLKLFCTHHLTLKSLLSLHLPPRRSFHISVCDENLSVTEQCASHEYPEVKFIKDKMGEHQSQSFFIIVAMRRPSQASLVSFIILFSVRNSFAYADHVANLVEAAPANASLHQCLWIYLLPKRAFEQVDVFICHLFAFCTSYSVC